MKVMKPILVIPFLLIALSGCKSNNSPAVADEMAQPLAKANAPVKQYEKKAEPNPATIDTSKKLIKEGSISFEASDLKSTRGKILMSLKNLNGYVAEEQENNESDSNQKQIILSLRVPSKNFDLLLDSISGDAEKVDSKNVSVKDVTAQYMDIETSLNNQKLLENRYRELLKKSDKMSDILEIESKLTEIRTSIDSTQGSLNYLSKQVAYSSLEVTFYVKQTGQYEGDTIGYKFKAAIKNGWIILQNLFFGIITLWPVILLIVVLYVLIKSWRKRRRLRKEQK
jgi:hypothetical protein